jgi:hypothetical protein
MFCISYRRNGSSLYPRWAVSRSRQSGRYDKSEVTDDRHSPALAETRGLAVLARRIFQTPVAFPTLLDHTEQVTARIGIGEEWWSVIEGFPLYRAFADAPIAPIPPSGCTGAATQKDWGSSPPRRFAAAPGCHSGCSSSRTMRPGMASQKRTGRRYGLGSTPSRRIWNCGRWRLTHSKASCGGWKPRSVSGRSRIRPRCSSSMEDRTRPDVRQQPVAGIHRPEHAGRDVRWLERLYPFRIPAACARGLRAGL